MDTAENNLNPETPKPKWYEATWFTVLMLFIFAPVGIFLLWKYQKFNGFLRVVLTCIFGLVFIGVAFGDDAEKPATTQPASIEAPAPTKETPATVPEPDKGTRKAVINKDYTINGLIIKVTEIEIEDDKVLIGTTLKNPTKNKLSFYPDQGNVVIGSMQLDSNMPMVEGDVSGEIQAGVEKSGVIAFNVPDGKTLNPNTVTQITLHWGDVYNQKTYASKEFDATLTIK